MASSFTPIIQTLISLLLLLFSFFLHMVHVDTFFLDRDAEIPRENQEKVYLGRGWQ